MRAPIKIKDYVLTLQLNSNLFSILLLKSRDPFTCIFYLLEEQLNVKYYIYSKSICKHDPLQ